MNILLLSSGGGGGNILRSLKALFRRDVLVTQRSDPRYAERLRRAVATRFLDTNEFSLSDVPKDERLLIGATTTRRLGSRHDPNVAREALEESKRDVEGILSRYSVVILIGTGGKGTGAGTMFPLAQMAREQRKLVIPIFVRPSFERHEVEKRRYDHALGVVDRFDSAGIRLMEILNDLGYRDANPEPQAVVWERMNLPIARGLRGLLYVLWDLSQVDPSDLSALFAGPGRLRIAYSELDPPAGREPEDDQIQAAVRACWENRYCAFNGPAGTSLVCIQGDWSNVVDGKIKGQLAALAAHGSSDAPYNPLYARAVHAPRPWGVTTLFAEYTGQHPVLDIDWNVEKRSAVRQPFRSEAEIDAFEDEKEPAAASVIDTAPPPAFSSFWEFALALNRSEPAALRMAGIDVDSAIPMNGRELRKLLGTFWFRSVFPRLSANWHERILNVLVEYAPIPDHVVRVGRRTMRLRELPPEQRRQLLIDPGFPDALRADLQFMDTVGTLWGEHALGRFEFVSAPESSDTSRIGLLLQPFRN
jgi:cell division GTPase FtsZ